MQDILYIIIPAYNEDENIKSVVNDWYKVIEKHNGNGKSRLVVIDDGSKDNTFAIMQEMAKDKPLFLPIHKDNSGHGATLLYGYNYAIENGAEYVFQTDSDGQTVPDEFEPFWQGRTDYDMIIGHRSKRQDGLSRVFVTKMLKFVLFMCFGVSIIDANTPFRLMKAETLKKYIGLIPENFNLSNVMISVIFAKKKCNVKFLPITFKPRQGGVNSINIKKIIKIGIKALQDFCTLNKKLV